MENICTTCGNKGYEEAFITCCQCNIHVHEYCVLGYCDDPPVGWCCEECDGSNGKMSSSHDLENESSDRSKLHSSAKTYHNAVQPMKLRKFPGGNSINWEKEVQTGKTRYLSVEEAISLSSGVKKFGSPIKVTGSSRPVAANSMANVPERNFTKPRAQVINFSTEKNKIQHSVGAAGNLKPQIRNIQATEQTKRHGKLSQENSELVSAVRRVKKFEAWNKSSQSKDNEEKRPRNRPEGRDDSTIPELRSPEAVNAGQMDNPLETCPCDPSLVLIWKGSFDIIGDIKPGVLNNQIQAHPPSVVSRKAYEFLSKMPDILQFELVPRGNIWTSIFDNHCPGKQDIGLYFFADEGKRSEILMDLVEFLRTKDMLMRALVYGVELFVLPSTVLSSDFQRWNNKFFLWGLFHRVRKDGSGCAEGGSNKEIGVERDVVAGEESCTISEVDMEIDEDVCTADDIDMEIDMIGGEDVGRVDICVSTRTSKEGLDRSLKDTVTAATCDRSEPVTSTVSRTSKGLPQVVEIKREPVDDFPPGFIPKTPK